MSLSDGFHDVPPGKVAAVVTHLEMRAPADLRPAPTLAGLTLRRVAAPSSDWYKDLFRRVGAEDWLWFSRLRMEDTALKAIIADPRVHIYTLIREGVDEGLLELDFREAGECELAFFGVSKNLIGTGAGRFLMNHAIEKAWKEPIIRFHVHTCTLDSPQALPFYIRSGFTPTRQQVEIADDPRLSGLLGANAGPHVPVFR